MILNKEFGSFLDRILILRPSNHKWMSKSFGFKIELPVYVIFSPAGVRVFHAGNSVCWQEILIETGLKHWKNSIMTGYSQWHLMHFVWEKLQNINPNFFFGSDIVCNSCRKLVGIQALPQEVTRRKTPCPAYVGTKSIILPFADDPMIYIAKLSPKLSCI